jgi:hypothetical protein
VPWLATLQIGVLYPPHVLYLLLPVRLAMPLLALGHLALLAFGTAAFARRVGLAWPGALLAAGLCTLAGQFPALVKFPNLLEAAVWLAPGCLAVAVLAEGRWRAGIVGLGFVAGMSLLAGYPQKSAYCIYAWAALLPGLLLARRAAPALWAKAGALFGAAIALGTAIAAVQLLPALELTREGTRTLEPLPLYAQFPYGFLQDPWRMLQGILHGRPPGRVLPLLLGGLGLALLPAALLVRRRRAVACVALALGLLALAFALGPATPLFDVFKALPLLGGFRNPQKILFVAKFFLAVAAGAGLDAVVHALRRRAARDGGGAREGRALLWGSVGFAVGLAVVLASSGFHRSALVAALLAALLAMATLIPRRAPAAAVGALALALALFEILSLPERRGRLLYADAERARVFHEELDVYAQVAGHADRVWIVRRGLRTRFPPGVETVFQMRSVAGYEPANLRRQAEYFLYLAQGPKGLVPGRVPFGGWIPLMGPGADPAALSERGRLLDLAAVRFALAPWQLLRTPSFARDVLRARLRPAGGAKYGWLYENRNAVPRAYVAYRTEAAPPVEELLARLAQRDFDPLELSYVEGPAGFEPAADAPPRGAPAEIVRDELHRVDVEATLDAPGMLVLADSYYPGWRALVDGEEVEIRAVNHLFRGVPLDAGSHRVRFDYRPVSVLAGGVISALGIGALIALIAWDRRRVSGTRSRRARSSRMASTPASSATS